MNREDINLRFEYIPQNYSSYLITTRDLNGFRPRLNEFNRAMSISFLELCDLVDRGKHAADGFIGS